MYWELGSGRRIRKGVRMGDWKAVQMDPRKPIELFNLATDESETNNIADAHPEIMAKIEEYLANCRTEPRPQSAIQTLVKQTVSFSFCHLLFLDFRKIEFRIGRIIQNITSSLHESPHPQQHQTYAEGASKLKQLLIS